MDKNIFFSYGHDENKEFVFKVAEILEEKGFKVFLDNKQLKAGKDWETKLEAGIRSNDKMVFFITPHSARRPNGYCLNEISMALHLEKDIIPVMLDYDVPPLSIIRLQFLDMQPFKNENKIEQFANQLIQVLNGEKELDSDGIYSTMYKKLIPEDFTQDFKAHQKIIGREWVKEKVDSWIEEHPESKVLWITAEVGYGKSAISAHLALTHPDVIGVNFCSYNHPNKNNPLNIIKTLAYHFQSQIEGYADEIVNIAIKDQNAFQLFEQLIANPLTRIKNEDKKFIFIIDGLDETLENKELIKLIGDRRFQLGLPENVKIIITSRPEPKLNQTLSGLNPLKLDAQQEKNVDDCKEFIQAKLEELQYSKYAEDDGFITTILEKSSANMLYLNIFFEEIEEKNINIDNPEDFPMGLNGIYEGFFERITQNEDIFDDLYAPLLEVILAYGESIPKSLLQDILGWGLKKFSRAIGKIGSMLSENDEKLGLYHKSISEWLVNEKNISYPVDTEEGKNKINYFIDNLTRDNYKEEYLEFKYFNRMLIDSIYKKEESLKNYFELLKSIKDDEKKIELLNKLGEYNALHNRMYKAIELQEKTYDLTTELYDNNKEKWEEKYTITLNRLGETYSKLGKSKEALALQKESLEILKRLYGENKDRWAEDYTGALNNLASIYSDIGQSKEALVLQKESLEIRRRLYGENEERWIDKYIVGLDMLEDIYDKLIAKIKQMNLGKNIELFLKNKKD